MKSVWTQDIYPDKCFHLEHTFRAACFSSVLNEHQHHTQPPVFPR